MHVDGTLEINDKTRIGLFTVMMAIPVFASFIFFVSLIYSKVEAQESRQNRQGEALREQSRKLDEINERTARIETLLSTMVHKK